MSERPQNPCDPWTDPYRGLTLHLGGGDRVWWHPYRGHGRLYMEETPEDLIAALKQVKPTGAQFRVTEQNDVLAKMEDSREGSYDPVWVGRLEDSTSLIVEADDDGRSPTADRRVELEPTDLSPGDLWPSIYDGTRLSMSSVDAVWWEDPGTNYRFDVAGIPEAILEEIMLRKPAGGSLRVTPWGDAITLVESVPRPKQLASQFDDLPVPIRQIIRIRKERGVEMLPVYVGSFDPSDLELQPPARLDEDLRAEQDRRIRSWIEELGEGGTTGSTENVDRAGSGGADGVSFDDDPDAWAIETLQSNEEDDEEWGAGGGTQ